MSTQAIAAAQGALFVTDASILPSGRWSNFSSDVYDRSTDQVKRAVDKILAAAGLSVYNLRSKAKEASTSLSNYIELAEVYKLIEQSAQLLGIPEYAEAIKGFVRLESPIKNGKVKFDAVNGRSMGIFQFQKAAWQDASDLLDKRGIQHERNYERGVFDPRENVLKGVVYALLNARQIVKAGVPVTASNLYLAHNQGAGFFSRGIVTGFDLQSNEVRAMIRDSITKRGVKPDFRGARAKW